ncbi:PAS domain-containing protein [Durusdinium trenchii]|uniref:PAS domain-containing protein n=1 Tax=Durusdinium trenchii TaxID=1381693 RepID=A0ABP0RIB5_9DINO
MLELSSSDAGGKTLSGFFEAAKNVGFGAFFVLHRQRRTERRLFQIGIVVAALQLAHLALSEQLGLPWSDQAISISQSFLVYLQFGMMPLHNEIVFLVLAGSAVLFVALNAAGFGLICYDVVRKKSEHTWVVPVTHVMLRLSQTILQQPIAALLSRMLVYDVGSQKLIRHGSSAHLALQSIAVLTGIVHLGLSVLSGLLLFQYTPYKNFRFDRGILAAPHGRVEGVTVAMRSLATMITCVLTSSSVPGVASASNKKVVCFVLVFTTGVILASHVHFQPFYSRTFNKLSVVCYSCAFWVSVCGVLAYFLDDPTDLSAFLLMVFALPFFSYSMLNIMTHGLNRLASIRDELSIQSPLLQELRLRKLFFSSSEPFAFSGEAERCYRKAVQNHPDSAFLALYVALLSTTGASKVIYSLNLIRQARQNTLWLDMDFFLFYHNKINEERQNHLSGAISFMALDAHLTKARSTILQTLKHIAQFWRKISSGSCTLNELLSHGSEIHAEATQCRFHLTKLLKLEQSNRETLCLYSIFLNYVMNDKEKAMRVVENLNNAAASNSEGFAVCMISGNASTLGHVLDVSQAMCSLLGYTKNEMMGRNISMICPAPFDALHDLFLKQFLGTDADFSTQTRRIYALHSQGYLIPVDFILTPSTNAHSDLILIGKITPVKLPESEHIVLVDAKTSIVTAMTQGAAQLLGFDDHDLFAMMVNICDIAPNFFNVDGALKYEREDDVQANHMLFRLRARLLDYSSKAGGPVSFECKVIVATFKLIDQGGFLSQIQNINDGDDPSSDAGVAAPTDDLQSDESNRSKQSERRCSSSSDGSFRMGHCVTGSPTEGSMQSSFRMKRMTSVASNGKKSFVGKTSTSRLRASGAKSPFPTGASQADRSSVGSSMFGDPRDLEISRIQRKITGDLNIKDPSIVRFTRFSRNWVVVVGLITIAESIGIMILYNDLAKSTRMAQLLHNVGHSIAKISIAVQYSASPDLRALLEAGNFSQSFPAISDPTVVVSDAANALKQLHEELGVAIVDDHHGTVHGSIVAAFEEPSLTVTGSGEDGFGQASFYVSVLDIVNHAESFLDLEATLPQDACPEACQYLLNNAMFDPINQASNLADMFHEKSLEDIRKVNIFHNCMLATVGILFLFSMRNGFVPLFRSFGKRKNNVGDAFLAIPYGICIRMQKRCESRYTNLQQNQNTEEIIRAEQEAPLEDDEDEDNDEDDEEEDEEKNAKQDKFVRNLELKMATLNEQATKGSQRMDSKSQASFNSKKNNTKKSLKIAPELTRKKTFATLVGRSSKKRQVAHVKAESKLESCTRNLRRSFQVGLSFLVVPVFFVVSKFLDQGNNSLLVHESTAVHVTGERFVLRDKLQFWTVMVSEETQLLDGQHFDFLEFGRIRANVSFFDNAGDALERLARIDAEVKYGNQSQGLLPFVGTTGELFDLSFSNACDNTCEQFGHAQAVPLAQVDELRRGVIFALHHHMYRARLVLNDAQAVRQDAGETNWTVALESLESLSNDYAHLESNMLLSSQLGRTMELQLQSLDVTIAKVRSLKMQSSVIFILLLWVSYLCSLTVVHRMEKELKKAQTLLLILPTEVFRKVPGMVELLSKNSRS